MEIPSVEYFDEMPLGAVTYLSVQRYRLTRATRKRTERRHRRTE
jgi:hypothetical protein